MLKNVTLGQFLPGNTLIHRLDPRMKILLTIAYIVGVFCVPHPLLYVVPALFLWLTAREAGLSARQLLKTLRPLIEARFSGGR